MELAPGGVFAWLVAGLIAGWLTGLVMKGGGYGIVGDLLLGIVGAFVGGFLLKTVDLLKTTGALPASVRGTLLPTLEEARAALARRQPVIVWVPLRLMAAQRVAVTVPSGKTAHVVEHEHTVTLRGYDGDQYLVLDPFDGSQPSYAAGPLAQSMRLFDDPALAIGRGA